MAVYARTYVDLSGRRCPLRVTVTASRRSVTAARSGFLSGPALPSRLPALFPRLRALREGRALRRAGYRRVG